MKKKKEKGITLVALVVTIVVLLILAGISINLVIGENGIITKAKETVKKTKESQEKERFDENDMNDNIVSDITGMKMIEGAPIPEGFYYVGGVRGKGVVISDSKSDNEKYKNQENVGNDLSGNQWVWVPVEDVSKLFATVSDGVDILGKGNIKTYFYSNNIIVRNEKRVVPGSKGLSEPNIVMNYDTEENVKEAGFYSTEDMARYICEEYAKMKESMEKYSGFFIGRYELSQNGEKSGNPITNNGWHKAYKICKDLYSSDYAITTMIWGVQWDATCDWLEKNGYNISDSSSWGNFSNNISEGAGELQITGYSESWKANNIYDFAGNCYEMTQEASEDEYGRCIRGGYCKYSGAVKSATDLFSSLRPSWASYDMVSTRTILII